MLHSLGSVAAGGQNEAELMGSNHLREQLFCVQGGHVAAIGAQDPAHQPAHATTVIRTMQVSWYY